MIEHVELLLERYWSWLKDRTALRKVGEDWIEITTPYLDRHNDYLQIFARQDGDGYLLTDDGYTITDLLHSGCKLDSPKRQALLHMTLAGFGVQLNGDRLEVRAAAENFPLKKHSLVQAMLAVNDLFFLAVPMVASLFYEDVVNWLDVNDIRYTPNVKFTGRSGLDHQFDFVIPKSRRQPERVVSAITRPAKDTAELTVFKWIDTKEVRSAESLAYALLNDQEQRIASTVLDALKSYDIRPVPWSVREQVREELAA